MIRFRELNPVSIGAAGLALVLVVLGLALNTDRLLALAGAGHSALFAEAGGLKSGDPVRVGGFDIGRVTAVELDGPDVRVDFRVTDDDAQLGAETRASVGVATILGQKYLKLAPTGGGELGGDPIPRSRTSAPYDLPAALETLTETSEAIDTPRLAEALDTISDTLHGRAPELRAAVDGVNRLSHTVASRDQDLRDLLTNAKGVSAVLAERSGQLRLLLGDGNLLLGELESRRQAIGDLLRNASALSRELQGLVRDNEHQIGPALDRLNAVIAVLEDNRDNIEQILEGAGIYATGLGEAVSNGPFFNSYVQNLVPGNLIPLADHLPGLAPPLAPSGGN
ncbi:MCE family protein [Pseudonocardia parietis]|uniref:Phospholipid/cholesterol/gamma-HCH transport system substrate-binding protein n=1 Tax=Pseudonocardia parietis TaxID=570936 RepID=A0ABS4VLL2_9PSEU|nr:MCE family protein [Pseudonocardia parietis]MBP2364801.1 phospholipid/cholesterol/gamma-HCH transport system substrate-binding protein [Pseudonocardia parietis]